MNSLLNPLRQQQLADLNTMLRIFRLVIPEISNEAEIVFTDKPLFKYPDGIVELQEYKISQSDGCYLKFVIAHLNVDSLSTDRVIVLPYKVNFPDMAEAPILLVCPEDQQKNDLPDLKA
jgi:hypothetical protein